MPELPEVETLKLGLQKYLVGHKILGLEIKDKKLFEGIEKNAVGAKIVEIRRFGKGLLIDLDNDYSIAIHVKLTGQLVFRDKKTKNLPIAKPITSTLPNKFTRAIFVLDKDSSLYFNDVRRFAWMKILKTEEVKKLPFFRELGPEPFDGLTSEIFRKIVNISGSPIKVLLMDQKRIGGIGNIYANDGLFDAGISPKRPAKSLSDEEIKKLYSSILKVLEKGLKYHGSSDLNFVDVLGQTGEYQQHFLVYGRKGKKCKRCDGIIQRISLGGRGTFYCPNCQK
ncbi:MAG: bifunctional DNA-formamidopyrimidine glycosylase/DNA-(apurinic or apyrimidinic site) lyase [Candidatus Levybacteria bacterium]|nr:bifunctional DNA-formamidopyrimidine glycosylase/DNA-(apurinic or apyrimidinic site) lyase [Candidatus Levybacteria bacterium]